LTEKILIVQTQFFQTGSSHIGQFQFGLFRGTRGLGTFRNVLHTGPGRLDHLVMRPAAALDITVAKSSRQIVNQLRHLKTLQMAVSPMFRNQRFFIHSIT